MRAQSLWDAMENGNNPPPLPTLAQIRNHNEEVAKKKRKNTCYNTCNTTSWYIYQDIESWNCKRSLRQTEERVPRELKNKEDVSI